VTDRELAALIAEKVMGWYFGDGLGAWFDPEHIFRHWSATWNPSTDILAACEVQSEMHRRGYRMRLEAPGDGQDENIWRSSFVPIEGGYAVEAVGGGSPAQAICLAALKAVGVEVS
jgi:Phage ABA sandwich domain